MASSIFPPPHHHHYYSDNNFLSTELICSQLLPEETMFNSTNTRPDDVVPWLNYDIINSTTKFPDQFGVADNCMVVPQMSEIVSGFRDFSVSEYQVFEQDYCGSSTTAGLMVPNFCQTNYNPMPPTQLNNWGIRELGKSGVTSQVEESTEVKVGRYSVEERKDRILRYLKKRNHRNFNKTIKYACRKTLADKRVRVRGRFAKNNEEEGEEVTAHDHAAAPNYQNNSFNYTDIDSNFLQQMKYEDDYWLQAAVDNLVHLPYLAT